jgi:hypothetical protein
MKIGLIDVDSHNFPNIALMKISAWHKLQGDTVVWYDPLFYADCNRVYTSKIFTDSQDVDVFCDDIIRGGSGYNLRDTLPAEIDAVFPDYSIYNITDTAYGYLTRGCPRGCEFCIVGEKEGYESRQMYKLNQFWNGQKNIKLLDPNITAAPNCISLFEELAETRASVDFTQGLDLRLITPKKIEAIKKIKIDEVHFAWDRIGEEAVITENLNMFIDLTGLNYRHIGVYILVNFDTTLEEDLHRVYTVRDMGAWPYVMIYDKAKADKRLRHLQRWVNNKRVFQTIETFEEYNWRIA